MQPPLGVNESQLESGAQTVNLCTTLNNVLGEVSLPVQRSDPHGVNRRAADLRTEALLSGGRYTNMRAETI